MSNAQNAADESMGSKKAFQDTIQAKTPSSTTCSFCWFVLKLYPTLKGMTDRDTTTFRVHLEKIHGLGKEIER